MKLRHLGRLIKIAFIWQKYGLGETLFVIPWLKPLRFVWWLNPIAWVARRRRPYPERLRLALEALGPLFIKFGQVLSTRADLFTEEIASTLSALQDNVKPFSPVLAKKIVAQSLTKPLNEIFSSFDSEPLASASIAQVHAATLQNGTLVAVKVLRPGIKKIIGNDLSLLYLISKLIERYIRKSRKIQLTGIVQELERSLLDELDLTYEAANASQLKRNTDKCSYIKIPTIYWDYCHKNVLVMERLNGIAAANLEGLKQAQVDFKKLAARGLELFYTQVFEDCFFHADLHPGNIFIDVSDPNDPGYILLDFGIVGSLTDADQYYLAANFLAFFKRDYRRVAKLHIESGWAPKGTSVVALEGAIRSVCEPIFSRKLKDISMGQTLMRLIHMSKKFDIEIQPQLILMQKTLLNIEGLARQYDPELDLWSTARPFLEKWMLKQNSVSKLLAELKTNLPQLIQQLPRFAEQFNQLIKKNL